MDMNRRFRKPCGVSTERKRPGRGYYLAAVFAGHYAEGNSCVHIYGHACRRRRQIHSRRRAGKNSAASASAGLAVALMRGQIVSRMGGVLMGIAGSIVDQPFFVGFTSA